MSFVTDNLDGIKSLLFVGLDFMKANFDQDTLVQYILMTRTTFVELGISDQNFTEWILEWGEKNEN
jgi:hypothetical protein